MNYGFRVLGDCRQPRRLIDWRRAFGACVICDERAELHRESYLSAFCFGSDFREHLDRTGSTAGFAGTCGAAFVNWDIDADGELERAKDSARRLVVAIVDGLRIADDDVLVFFSGAKGFHVSIPTVLWRPKPGRDFHRIARRFAEKIAERAGANIDSSVYDRVRCFRAPNSRHPRSGLHKRRLSVDELMHLRTDAILNLANEPAPFELPEPSGRSEQAADDWRDAAEQVGHEAEAMAHRRRADNGAARLNTLTLEFICNGAPTGGAGVADEAGRHRRLYSAAANLAEFGCPHRLAHELLTESALDSGLTPLDVRRAIDNGLGKGGGA